MQKKPGQIANLPNDFENQRSIAAIFVKKYGRAATHYTYLKALSATLIHRELTPKEVAAVLKIMRKAGKLKT